MSSWTIFAFTNYIAGIWDLGLKSPRFCTGIRDLGLKWYYWSVLTMAFWTCDPVYIWLAKIELSANLRLVSIFVASPHFEKRHFDIVQYGSWRWKKQHKYLCAGGDQRKHFIRPDIVFTFLSGKSGKIQWALFLKYVLRHLRHPTGRALTLTGYRLQTKFRNITVFTPICDSVHGGGGVHPPSEKATAADGTHPTGMMHSCL